MQKREIRLIGVATIIGALAVGAFLMQDEDHLDIPVAMAPRPSRLVAVPTEASQSKPVETTTEAASRPVELAAEANKGTAEHVDPLVVQQEKLLKEFKDKIKLNINLPGDMRYNELDLDDNVAAMQGDSPDKKLAILAASKTASPQAIAAFLQEHKGRIPLLGTHDFKISGDLQNIPAPKNSGISKITVIPGGEKNGSLIFAAHLERSDKKGSYLMIMEGSPSYFENYDGDMDNMLSSISVK